MPTFTLRTVPEEIASLPAGARALARSRPAALTCVLSGAVGTNVGVASALIGITAPVDPCAAINEGTVPIDVRNLQISAGESSIPVALDWAASYRVVSAEIIVQDRGSFPYANFVCPIEHINVPVSGKHCREIRLLFLPEAGDYYLYEFVDVNSVPATANTPNPLASGFTSSFFVILRFHATDGVLTLEPQ